MPAFMLPYKRMTPCELHRRKKIVSMHHTQKENLCVLSVLENSEQLKVITKHE